MPNTSATGGYLQPTVLVSDDSVLDLVFQPMISGITGLDGSLVRARWQVIPPKQPDPQVNWCAFGISSATGDDGPVIVFDSVNLVGYQIEHEWITLLTTFYGPLCGQYAKLLRDGLAMPQNTEALGMNNIRYISPGVIRAVPELINQQWAKRQDMALSFRRSIKRTYQTTSILSAPVNLIDDTTINDLITVPTGATLEP